MRICEDQQVQESIEIRRTWPTIAAEVQGTKLCLPRGVAAVWGSCKDQYKTVSGTCA